MAIKKIPSFTLSEILIGLVLTVIVVGLSFTALNIVNKNVLSIQKNYHSNSNKSLFEQQLTIDFNTYNSILLNKTADEILLMNPLDSINYIISEGNFIREKDTIIKGVSNISFFNFGNQIKKGSLDALKVNFDEQNEENFIFIFKQNDATQKMMTDGD